MRCTVKELVRRQQQQGMKVVSGKGMRSIPSQYACEVGVYEVHTHEMHVCEIHIYEIVERLNEHSLENYLGRQRATAIYIVGDWVCHDFNRDARP
jgi:hypothetical protein